ncbi:MAG: hypothetical protein LBQ75_01765, partial [Zoogloeaceae bacterium]|nr:hypothetical protein [Zoogloeaceae bacterium]
RKGRAGARVALPSGRPGTGAWQQDHRFSLGFSSAQLPLGTLMAALDDCNPDWKNSVKPVPDVWYLLYLPSFLRSGKKHHEP